MKRGPCSSRSRSDREVTRRTLRAVFDKRGLKERFETTEDEKLKVDLSRMPPPDLRKITDLPVVELIVDDMRLADLNALKNLKLESLSANRTLVADLTLLGAMPLRVSFHRRHARRQPRSARACPAAKPQYHRHAGG